MALGVVIGFFSYEMFSEEELSKGLIGVVCSIAMVSLSFWMPWEYITNSPAIRIDNQSISFGFEKHKLSEIKDIVLVGKVPYPSLWTVYVEGASITFKDGLVKYIYEDKYSNSSDLKLHLQKNLGQQLAEVNLDNLVVPVQVKDKSFGLNHILTFNGLVFYALLGVYGWLLLGHSFPSIVVSTMISLLAVTSCGFISYQMHFVEFYQNQLVVRNSIWFWRRKIYRFENIHEVVIEIPYRLSTSIRIVTSDFKSKLYPAGNLGNSDWKELIAELEDLGIHVRNEAV